MLNFAEEADLEAALERGDFTENHYREAKRILGASSRGNNKELARDLAQFALDGGVLVFGVDEDKVDHSFSLTPFEMPDGALERIEQIAQTICQPPLPVAPRYVASEEISGAGYIVVDVPISALAPHMVDGRYLARGETQKQYLDDTSVRAILASRAHEMDRADLLLDQLIGADPLGTVESSQRNAHFFAVAVPLTAPEGDDADRQLLQDTYFAARSAVRTEHMLSAFPSTSRTRSTGCVMLSNTLVEYGAGLTELVRTDRWRSIIDQTAEFGVRHDGGIWAYHSRLSKGDDRGAAGLFPEQLVSGVRMVVVAAAKWAELRAYYGSWALGVATTGMAGSSPTVGEFWDVAPVLADDRYRRTTHSTTAELSTDPDAIADRLAGRFLAMCGR